MEESLDDLLGAEPGEADIDPKRDCTCAQTDGSGEDSSVHSNARASIPVLSADTPPG
jgi:hypothetical protein